MLLNTDHPAVILCALILLLGAAAPLHPLYAQRGHADRYVPVSEISADGVELETAGVELDVAAGTLRLEPVTPTILHVQVSPGTPFSDRKSLAVLDRSVASSTARTDGDHLVLSTDSLTARVHRRSGKLTVTENAQGRTVTTAHAPTADHFERVVTAVDTAWSVRQSFSLTPEEGLFGLGQYQEGWLNYRGRSVLLAPSNTRAAIPFLVSSRGYGILWDNYSKSHFASAQNRATFEAEVADQVDYYVVAGRTPDDAIAGYRTLTGTAPLYPKWAYGYWQSRERYETQQQVLDVAAEFRERDIPIDNLVQDWNYWPGNDYFSGMVWDSTRYPDPAGMVDTLHDEHDMQLMISFWPALGQKSPVYQALAEKGHVFSEPHWADARVYDAYSPEARDIYWTHIKKALYDKGIDAWWMDGTEPEFRTTDDRYMTEEMMKLNGPTAMGSFDRYLSTFSLQSTKGVYRRTREASNERPFILTRSAFAGQQRYGATLWSGDIWASWTVFRDQIATGLNTSMAGYPYWTADAGAFVVNHRFPDGNEDPAYRELYTRWHQFAAFLPMFRSHGTDTEREPWYYGEPGDWAYDAILRANRLRYRLMPYIYTQGWRVHEHDASIIRPLPLAFPEDPAGYDANQSYLFGPNLLVSPVTKAMRHEPSKIRQFITTEDMYDGSGTEHYLTQTVYEGTAFDTLVSTRKIENLRTTWQGSLPPSVRDTPYSLRYTGRLGAEAEGPHEFIATVDGGVRLRVNGKTVIDAWDATGGDDPTEHRGTISLEKGEKADITLEYKQPTANTAYLILEWRAPGMKDQVVADTKQWPTYLPEGTDWVNFWTGKRVAGGRTDSMHAPISRIPLYVPEGTILPLGPDRQYLGETSADTLEIRVYPGTDATYTLYDDAGNGPGYTSGEHVRIPLSWDESAKTLTIGDRKGSYPGMLKERTVRVVRVGPERGTGLSQPEEPDAAVTYTGEEVTVLLNE